jgi:hypothetical protein
VDTLKRGYLGLVALLKENCAFHILGKGLAGFGLAGSSVGRGAYDRIEVFFGSKTGGGRVKNLDACFVSG